MSGTASNVSGHSTGSSSRTRNGRVVGVPKKCWCGEHIVALMSKSNFNPYRRYYRCSFAASMKLENDNHTFKWIDEAMLNEIETLQFKNARLEEELKVIKTERMVFENVLFENVQMKLEKDILERVEDVLVETKCSMKKMMIAVIIGCMVCVGCIKLL